MQAVLEENNYLKGHLARAYKAWQEDAEQVREEKLARQDLQVSIPVNIPNICGRFKACLTCANEEQQAWS